MAEVVDAFAPRVPTWAAVHLTHAALQAVADGAGVDLLHIKGPTDARFRIDIHDSTDADVLVRPRHVDAFTRALEDRGWVLVSGFDEGSPFGHAANYQHPAWTWVDVHRSIPGFRRRADDVFDRLWGEREHAEIAHWPCATLSPRGQVLVQVMHVARSHGSDRPETWMQCPDELRPSVRALADELGGAVAFAAGVGELDAYRGDRDYALWRYWSQPNENRISEWAARVRSAPGFRARLRVVTQAGRVNHTRLRMRLGHEPTATEVAHEQVARIGHALGSAWAALTARIGSAPRLARRTRRYRGRRSGEKKEAQ